MARERRQLLGASFCFRADAGTTRNWPPSGFVISGMIECGGEEAERLLPLVTATLDLGLTGARGSARRPVHRPAGPAGSAGGSARGRAGGAADTLTRRTHATTAVYRQAHAAARACCAQPRPHGIGSRAGQDTVAPAVAPAGIAHTGMRAPPRACHPTRRSGPMAHA